MESNFNNLPKEDQNQIELISENDESNNKSNKSNILVIGKKENDEESCSFKYVKNDHEEEVIMEKIGRKNKDFDLLDHLVTGEYFSNEKYLKKKRKQYGVVREKRVEIKDYYKRKYFQKLEEIDNRKRGLDQENKNYQLEYYNVLELNDKKDEEISDLKNQIDELRVLLRESREENVRLKEDNNKLATNVGDLELENVRNMEKFRNEKKRIFKKAMIKCPICFDYCYKGDITFINCGHFTCKKCFPGLPIREHGKTCAVCNREGIYQVQVPHYGDDLNSDDFNHFEGNH